MVPLKMKNIMHFNITFTDNVKRTMEVCWKFIPLKVLLIKSSDIITISLISLKHS